MKFPVSLNCDGKSFVGWVLEHISLTIFPSQFKLDLDVNLLFHSATCATVPSTTRTSHSPAAGLPIDGSRNHRTQVAGVTRGQAAASRPDKHRVTAANIQWIRFFITNKLNIDLKTILITTLILFKVVPKCTWPWSCSRWQPFIASFFRLSFRNSPLTFGNSYAASKLVWNLR